MTTKVFVGSLPYSVTDDRLREAFAAFGNVVSATVIMDRDTNRSKGFGFVEFETEAEAQASIDGLNNQELDGRRVTVSPARPKQ